MSTVGVVVFLMGCADFRSQAGIVISSSISKGDGIVESMFEIKGNNLSLNTTLRETMIFFAAGSHSRYALAPLSYPTSTHLLDFGASFDNWVVLRSGYVAQPIALRKSVLLEWDPRESSCQSL